MDQNSLESQYPYSSTLTTTNILVCILVLLILVAAACLNFTFFITLIKLRRLNSLDKSNALLTHLILVDFIAAFCVLIPSAYGIYNGVGDASCHLQTWFSTFATACASLGLLVLSIERYVKYRWPVRHVNTFTVRLEYDKYDRVANEHHFHFSYFIIVAIWLTAIFVACIPLFGTYDRLEFFASQGQCSYTYETMKWWLWFWFICLVTLPFLVSLVLFFLTFRLIRASHRVVQMKRVQYELEASRRQALADRYKTRSQRKERIEPFVENLDVTLQPCNTFYYTHIVDDFRRARHAVNRQEERVEGEDYGDEYDYGADFHVRNQLLAQYKYETEREKNKTFFIIAILNYVLVFPLIVCHFYRAYNNTDGLVNGSDDFDGRQPVNPGAYTTFVLVSFFTLLLKSLVCLTENDGYRQAFLQAANCRGFKGDFDFQKELKLIRDVLDIDESTDEDVDNNNEDSSRRSKKKRSGLSSSRPPTREKQQQSLA